MKTWSLWSEMLLEEYEKWGLKISLENNFQRGCGAETKDLMLED